MSNSRAKPLERPYFTGQGLGEAFGTFGEAVGRYPVIHGPGLGFRAFLGLEV